MTRRRESSLAQPPTDWKSFIEAAVNGDRIAYARLIRLVTGYLSQWRAFDFRPDWDDIVQEVLLSTVNAYCEGRLADSGAVAAYARQAARFKFIDRIRASARRSDGEDPEESLERGEADASWPPAVDLNRRAGDVELRASLVAALESLPDRERSAVFEVHIRGRTYEEAASETGIPLGSLKRVLRGGLATLLEVLDD